MENYDLIMNVEAEEAILGGILLDSNAIETVKNYLSVDAFTLEAHRIIYRVACEIAERDEKCDLMSISTKLTDEELLDVVGGMSRLSSLLNRTVSATNIDRYALLVLEKYRRRKLIELGQDLVKLAYDREFNSEQLDSEVSKLYLNWLENRQPSFQHQGEIEINYSVGLSSHSSEILEQIRLKTVCNSIEEIGEVANNLKSKLGRYLTNDR